ncbi:conserved hypothetical protein [Pediculus humanus corporis]|uniref:Protein THEM6 n=1 Tax=Pediculus humanus subsp. corporis TaxID=121224 RepID=E0VCD5_PEDHC|nr:uncharacterized protein Phum_PHUM085730 [Pediculus humanus corporis]EEB11041.1 conserved hypothetical protein [Pediculus humanus corporis]
MTLCFIFLGLILCALLIYVLLEIHYFMRMLLVLICSLFKENVYVLDECTMSGICLTTDVDVLLFHMNNARYVRELDFARFDFFKRTGLLSKIKGKGGGVVQGGNSIRYRKYIRPFTVYQIRSKILYWDDKNIYMEHRFITPKDDFVRAIALGRHRIINCDVNDVMRELLQGILKPSLPLELAKWIECNEISSSNLRNNL